MVSLLLGNTHFFDPKTFPFLAQVTSRCLGVVHVTYSGITSFAACKTAIKIQIHRLALTQGSLEQAIPYLETLVGCTAGFR